MFRISKCPDSLLIALVVSSLSSAFCFDVGPPSKATSDGGIAFHMGNAAQSNPPICFTMTNPLNVLMLIQKKKKVEQQFVSPKVLFCFPGGAVKKRL